MREAEMVCSGASAIPPDGDRAVGTTAGRFVVAGFRGGLEKMLSSTADRGFESFSLQRRVCKLSVPLAKRLSLPGIGIGIR
jgi:hypothetical protein